MKISKSTIVKWKGGKKSPKLNDFINRPSTPAEAEKAAALILADIRKNGDKAIVASVADHTCWVALLSIPASIRVIMKYKEDSTSVARLKNIAGWKAVPHG